MSKTKTELAKELAGLKYTNEERQQIVNRMLDLLPSAFVEACFLEGFWQFHKTFGGKSPVDLAQAMSFARVEDWQTVVQYLRTEGIDVKDLCVKE